jgi:hypothetical protein
MSSEISKAADVFKTGLIAGAASGEAVEAVGQFIMECYDKDGALKWSAQSKNLVVNVGRQYMANAALTGGAVSVFWYIGLYGAGSSNTPALTDTMVSHIGWTEITPYSNVSRPTASFSSATSANPSVVTNAATPASFAINASATVGGAFLVNNDTKGASSGTLFSAADFSTGDRSVVSGDTLNVTYQFQLSA